MYLTVGCVIGGFAVCIAIEAFSVDKRRAYTVSIVYARIIYIL